MTVLEASKILNVSPQFIRVGLQQQRLPWGYAVRVNKRWAYYINAERVNDEKQGIKGVNGNSNHD